MINSILKPLVLPNTPNQTRQQTIRSARRALHALEELAFDLNTEQYIGKDVTDVIDEIEEIITKIKAGIVWLKCPKYY